MQWFVDHLARLKFLHIHFVQVIGLSKLEKNIQTLVDQIQGLLGVVLEVYQVQKMMDNIRTDIA